MDKKITIKEAVQQLLDVVEKLRQAYPVGNKKFTLDGRLVGDIGEILVAEAYGITLFDGLQKHHDGRSSNGLNVQIKATMKASLTFPADHVPEHYIGIKIHSDGTFTEIFNGPGNVAKQAIENRAQPKTNLHSVTISALAKLNATVETERKILRKSAEVAS